MSRFPHILLRRVASWGLYLALIVVSCLLQLWITQVAEDERERRLVDQRVAFNDDADSATATTNSVRAHAATS